MQEKKLFLDMIDYELPESLVRLSAVGIPELDEIASPTTVEAAIIATGQLSANVNEILRVFAGLPLVELILRNGGRNPLLKALVIAAYDIFGELDADRLSELAAMLTKLKSTLEGLIGTGSIPQAVQQSFQFDKQQLALQAQQHPEQASMYQQIINAIDECVAAANQIITPEELDDLLNAVIDPIASALDWIQSQVSPGAPSA